MEIKREEKAAEPTVVLTKDMIPGKLYKGAGVSMRIARIVIATATPGVWVDLSTGESNRADVIKSWHEVEGFLTVTGIKP